ncbi:MAG: B12-binding domain-containing radical SAM protein [Anaerohalosphaeraceae bacterium]|nr:B12-binding domain-containing radical SAM protein [Anaerohalosphaeraceae bacterium]
MSTQVKSGARPGKLVLIAFCEIEALGVRSLHAFLKEKGVDVELVFFKDRVVNDTTAITDSDIDLLISQVRQLGPNIVGLSFFSALYRDAVKITRRLKEELNVLVIWGGIHAIVRPEESIQSADAVCVGEGEHSLLDFYNRVSKGDPYNEVSGFWVRMNGQVSRNQQRPLIQDLDSLPFFDYSDDGKHYITNDGVVYHKEPFHENSGRGRYFQTSYVLQTTRGCPYKCTYCSQSVLKKILNTNHGKFVRTHGIEKVIENLLYAKKQFPNLKDVAFRDEIFGLNKAWLNEFCYEYKEKIGLPFRASIHPNVIKSEHLEKLVDAGLYSLDIGIQSGSERVRKEVFDRNTPSYRLLSVFRDIKRVGIVPNYDVIVDNPWETEVDKDEAIRFFLQIPHPYNLRVFSLTFLPATPLAERALAEGIIDETQIEGYGTKAMNQWRMTLDQERGEESLFWSSIVSLLSKSFIPRVLIKQFYYNRFLRTHPKILASFAQWCNILKTGLIGMKYLLQGKIGWSFIRTQWRNVTRVTK